MLDLLLAIGFPDSYTRNDKMERLNGPLTSGKEIGYDLAQYIRDFMKARGYQKYSVVELLLAANYPGVGRAVVLLSHVQSELVQQTTQLLFEASVIENGNESSNRENINSCKTEYPWRFWLQRTPWAPFFINYFSLDNG